jgi:2,4-dienoyl-CoA reductase-like NADH-dependent reductase (Old Yellow Enzyme family)
LTHHPEKKSMRSSMSNHAAPYLKPGKIGSLTLNNRLVRAATSESMATADGVATDALVRLYGDLAKGGTGLIITGHIYVEPRGQYTPNQPGLHHDRMVEPLARATRAVHDHGGKIFAELGHAGSQSLIPGIIAIAPSVVPNAIFDREPQAMSVADIEEVVAAFGSAARRAIESGFDGIHIHGGNGYLISEFSSPHTNLRTDEWGGDAERRGRFMLAIYDAVRSAIWPKVPITARIGVADAVAGGLQVCESVQRAKQLKSRGINGFEATYGVMNSYLENVRPYVAVGMVRALISGLIPRLWTPAGPEAYYREFARTIRSATNLPVILVGGIRTTQIMSDVIASGDADFLAMARPFLREPGLARELAAGRTGMVDCVSCNICLMHDGIDPVRCWRKKPIDLAFHLYCRLWRDRN